LRVLKWESGLSNVQFLSNGSPDGLLPIADLAMATAQEGKHMTTDFSNDGFSSIFVQSTITP
jgi:hypothetical protein